MADVESCRSVLERCSLNDHDDSSSRRENKEQENFRNVLGLADINSRRLIELSRSVVDDVEAVAIVPLLIDDRDRFKVALGQPLVDLLENLGSATRGGGESIEGSAGLDTLLQTISRELRLSSSLTGLMRQLRQRMYGPCSELLSLVHALLRVLQRRLQTSPEHRRCWHRRCEILEARLASMQAQREQLEANARSLQKREQRTLDEQHAAITHLQREIEACKNKHRLDVSTTLGSGSSTEARTMMESAATRSELTRELAQFRLLLQTTLQMHRESELALRKKKYRTETEVENWIRKYDEDMSNLQKEHDEIFRCYQAETERLLDLKSKLEPVETSYEAILEERRLARLEQQQNALELRRRTRAAQQIQTVWRAYLLNKRLRRRRKRKKNNTNKSETMQTTTQKTGVVLRKPEPSKVRNK